MNHVEGVRESIHSIDPFNSLSHNLNNYQERKCKWYKAPNVWVTSDQWESKSVLVWFPGINYFWQSLPAYT